MTTVTFFINFFTKRLFRLNFRLKNKENTIVRDYVLPDYANIRKGYAKSHENSTGKPMNSEQVTLFQLLSRKGIF